ncbi:MAG: methyltransferase domain-containing protein [Candidatus Nitrosopelagicus sp.]|jgi:cyclopropane fatty-acyl-phospholipid synthase-like methyltransferase|nr:methyltransferase domain-containing protein [Candidatus Nitrosopelagicus sp.]
MQINLFEMLLWTFRRNENDVVNLYDSLSPIMQLSTDGDMLNFGYWDNSTDKPIEAQKNLCEFTGKFANLSNAKSLIDVGGGILGPARKWQSDYPGLEIFSININYNQLKKSDTDFIQKINSTSRFLPFTDSSVDRIIALESAQHFKPLEDFFLESKRILKDDGDLVIAMPVVSKNASVITDLGILSFTWSSEHYTIESITSKIISAGFSIIQSEKIGDSVYTPLAQYYFDHRKELQERIRTKYSSTTEKILFKSLEKMSHASKNNLIDYIILKCA